MADENPELKAFADYHKFTTEMNKINLGTSDHISKTHTGLLEDMTAAYKKLRGDKSIISAKDEKEARKTGEGLYSTMAKTAVSKYLGIENETLDKLMKQERMSDYFENTLEQFFGVKRDAVVESIASRKTVTAENILQYTLAMMGGTKNYELKFTKKKATSKFWEDPKTFNKYLRMIASDNANKPAIAETLKELREEAKIDGSYLFDSAKKDQFDPRINHEVWAILSQGIGSDYDFKKKLEELAKKAA